MSSLYFYLVCVSSEVAETSRLKNLGSPIYT